MTLEVPSIRSIETTLPLSSTTMIAACPFSAFTKAVAASTITLASSREMEAATSIRGRVANTSGTGLGSSADTTETLVTTIRNANDRNIYILTMIVIPLDK